MLVEVVTFDFEATGRALDINDYSNLLTASIVILLLGLP